MMKLDKSATATAYDCDLNDNMVSDLNKRKDVIQNFNKGMYDGKIKAVSLGYVVLTVVIFLFLIIYYLIERKSQSL